VRSPSGGELCEPKVAGTDEVLLKNGDKPIANPYVLLREEFDDWAVLFNPDSGHGFGLSSTGVYPWKLLDGEHSIDHLVKALRRDALDAPENVQQDAGAFIDALVAEGLATFESNLVWYMNWVTEAGSADLTPLAIGPGLSLVPVTSGNPDILWRIISTGSNVVWYVNGATMTSWAALPSVSD